MRRDLMLTLLLILAAFCSSCEKEQNAPMGGKKGVITFSIESESRATQEGTFENGDKIGVFVYNRGNTSSPIYTNVPYKYENGKFVPVSTEILQMASGYDIYVYCPYSSSANNPTDIRHEAVSQSTVGAWYQSDFLTATFKGTIKDGNVPLIFKHRYATLQFLKGSGDDISGVVFPIDKVYLKNVRYKSSANLLSGQISTLDERTDIAMLGDRFSTKENATMSVATIPVQSLTEDFLVEVLTENDKKIQLNPDVVELREGEVFPMYYDAAGYGWWLRVKCHPEAGTVQGSGFYHYNEAATCTVTPNSGYEFEEWELYDLDGESEREIGKSKNNPLRVDPNNRLDVLQRVACAVLSKPIEKNLRFGESEKRISVSATSYTPILYLDTRKKTYISIPSGITGSGESIQTSKERLANGYTLTTLNPEYSVIVPNENRVLISPNTGLQERIITLNATYQGMSATMKIIQAAASYNYTFTWSDRTTGYDDKMANNGEDRSSAAGSISLPQIRSNKSITSNLGLSGEKIDVSYKLTSIPSWIKLSGNTLLYEKNSSPYARRASIVFTQEESGKTITYTFRQKRGQGVVGN